MVAALSSTTANNHMKHMHKLVVCVLGSFNVQQMLTNPPSTAKHLLAVKPSHSSAC